MARRSWFPIAIVSLVVVVAALGFASNGSALLNWTSVSLTATGPSPSTFATYATDVLVFDNKDSVAHTVTFTNDACSFSVPPGYSIGPGGQSSTSDQETLPPACASDFTFYAGSYPYTVDGKYPGTIEVDPVGRSVTLTARTHTVRRGAQLTLHGLLEFAGNFGPACCKTSPFPIAILARDDSGSHAFKRIATLWTPGDHDTERPWHLHVRPGVPTTYIAEISGQLPEGRIWTQAPSRSRPFTVRIGR